jgi:AdoMet-dependent rRNA methyltransferase SPB1
MDLDAHPATTPEIRSLCADLGVLGRVDFKNLLKWRLAVRKSKGLDGKRKAALRGGVAAADDDETPDEPGGDASADASDSDEKILEEMAELQQGVDARARRDKKKKAKLRAKERMRTALGLVGQDEEGATGASEMDLFSLARIKSKGGLNAVQAAAAPGIDASRDSDDDLGDVERRAGARGKYDDSSEEEADAEDGRANDARLEAELDLMWREYKARHGKKGVKFTEKSGGRDARVAIGAGEIGSDDDDDEDDQAGAAMRRAGQRALAQAMQDAAPANPLLFDPDAPAKKKTKGPAAATDWFANDLFGQAAPEVGSKTQAKSEAKAELRKAREAEARAKAAEEDGSDDDEEDGFDDDDEYFDDDADDADDESESEEAVTRDAKLSSRKRAKTTVGADVGDADSDEEDYDAIRVASAAKAKREEAKAAKTKAREEAKANSVKKAKKNAASTNGGGVSKKHKANAYDDTYDDDTDSSEDDGGAGLSGADPVGTKLGRARRGKDNAGFLEAPAEPEANSDSSGSDTDSDPDDISDGEKAEILAIGKNMIRKKDRVRQTDELFLRVFVSSEALRGVRFGFGFSVFPSRAGEDDLSLKNNRHRLNLDGRSPECPGT